MCLFCQFPRIFYLLLAAIVSQGKHDSVMQEPPAPTFLPLKQALYKLLAESVNALKVTTPFALGQQPASLQERQS